uniref:POU-specific domain-containing protein n=1 Tax=Loxodonta africana TaxID=9785 RepID=G3UHL2_LOXAF
IARHLAADFAFWPPPEEGPWGPGSEPGWADPHTRLNFQGTPGGPGIGLGAKPSAERVLWQYGSQIGMRLVPQGGLEVPQPEGEVKAGVESNSEGTSPETRAATLGPLKLNKEKMDDNPEGSQGIKTRQKNLEQFAKLLKQKRITPGYSRADVGLTLGVLFGKVFCRFEALQLSFKNMCELRPVLQKWLEEEENNETSRRYAKLGSSSSRSERENGQELRTERGSLDSWWKPSWQLIGHIAQQFRLEKDVAQVWFCNLRQTSKRSVATTSNEDFEAAGSLFPGGPVSLPLAPGPYFGIPGCGGSPFISLYSPVPFSEEEAYLSVQVTPMGSPMHSD